MRALALLLARPTWYALVWLMRRRWMRAVQLWPTRLLRPPEAARFVRRHNAQNRFARRIGLTLLVISFELLLASLLINLLYRAATALIEGGYLRPPSIVRPESD